MQFIYIFFFLDNIYNLLCNRIKWASNNSNRCTISSNLINKNLINSNLINNYLINNSTIILNTLNKINIK